MPVAQIYQYVVIDRPGRPAVQIGSLSEARSVTLGDGELIDRDFKIAPTTAVKVFDASEDEALGNADFIWMEADLDLLVEFTADPGVGDVYFVVELKGSGTAGQMGPALVLGSDLAHKLDGSVNVFDGTEDTIQEIWVYNEDATDTSRVRLVAAT